MTQLRAINDLARHNGALGGELREAVGRVLASGWYVLGREGTAFEEAFAGYCGVPFAVGVANGTEALELALRAVGVAAGDRVALVANAGGYGTVALAAIGAQPIYVDIDPSTLNMDPDALAAALVEGDITAVLVTHLYGRLAPIERIGALAAAAGIRVVEDCAQAHGASRNGRRAGSWGDAAAFSFYPTKNLGALGDGGAVTTGDPEVSARVRSLRQYGWERKYHATHPHGRNSRLDEVQAAVLLTKLPHLDGWNSKRAAIAARYDASITNPAVVVPRAEGPDHVAHLYVLRVAQRDGLGEHLRALGVPHDVHYPVPDHRQAIVAAAPTGVSLPATEQACAEVLTLPCFPEMTDSEVDWVASAVNEWRP